MASVESLKREATQALKSASNIEALNRIEQEYFGRKQGKLTSLLRTLKGLPESERKKVGAIANQVRKDLESLIKETRFKLNKNEISAQLQKEKIDVTLPGSRLERGHYHPMTLARREAEQIFNSMGFTVAEGPQVETDFYNFDALNIPEGHPARDLWDTFWLKDAKYALRPHTSPVQIRYMEENNPPLRIIAPGKVFRHEATDASHDFEFWQLEGLMVGKDVSVADLKHTLSIFFKQFFGSKITIRLRPSYFPFVEPGFEVDVSCINCKGKGCSVCQQTGWVELLGAGMVHQKVFKAVGYIPDRWQGWAFGVGLDRLAMMKYNIPDVRLFRQSDIRFLKQF
jgi:phenylalanyl-tRNA synthetase alpha chain